MKIDWPARARADLRAIDREAAVQILHALAHFARSGEGDVKALKGRFAGLRRLRVGDYRVFFMQPADSIYITRILHRSQAYR
jgi:mRNA-degrading endonuclease RelE of RelBE toxin-antitoxin system